MQVVYKNTKKYIWVFDQIGVNIKNINMIIND